MASFTIILREGQDAEYSKNLSRRHLFLHDTPWDAQEHLTLGARTAQRIYGIWCGICLFSRRRPGVFLAQAMRGPLYSRAF